jgi:agmatine deiminase
MCDAPEPCKRALADLLRWTASKRDLAAARQIALQTRGHRSTGNFKVTICSTAARAAQNRHVEGRLLVNRRRFAHAAPMAFVAGCGGSEDAGAGPLDLAGAADFRMPDEAEGHERTWMGFTSSSDIWGSDLPGVQSDLMRIADAIAAFEPVSMLVERAALGRANQLRNQAANRTRIALIEGSLDDLWLRDTGPVFVVNAARQLRAVDFNFNGWGRKQRFAKDAGVAAAIAEMVGVPVHKSGLTLEGGGLEVDGQGTAIVKESCVLNANRNPGLRKSAVESALRSTLGLEKIIWLPGPGGGDITDAHTDFYARFAGEARVVVSHDAADTYGERRVTQGHIDVLRQATDAQGRSLALTVIPVPTDPASPKADNESFAAGYINYYLCNGGLILPAFGDAGADRFAMTALQRHYPTRKIVPLRIDAIAAGGGGIHCTTQQQPAP